MNVLLIGLDLGTTAIKACAYTTDAEEVAVSSMPSPVTIGPDGSYLVQPDELVFVVRECLDRLEMKLGDRKAGALAVSAAMFSVFPLDKSEKPLAPSRTWADTTAQCVPDAVDFYQLTGCRTHPAYPRDRIRLIRECEPDLFRSSAKWVSLAEYLFHKLTGKWAVSRSLASSTGLLDIHRLEWADDVLRWCGISEDQLSPLTSETYSATILNGPFAGVPMVIGATDGPLCHFGTDSLGYGQMTSTIGTSGALRLLSDKPVLDVKERTWCYYLTSGMWVFGGAINSGAVALQWLKENIFHEAPLTHPGSDPLIQEALREVPPGSDGITFLPTLTGERSPNWDPALRGAVYGLSVHHGRSHLARSVLEGIVFRLYSVYRVLKSLRRKISTIRASGGYTNTPEWLQLQADVFGFPIELASVSQASTFGAACLAGEAIGAVSAGEMASNVTVRAVISPNPELFDAYMQAYERMEKLYRLARRMAH